MRGDEMENIDAKELIEWLETRRDDTHMTSRMYPWACGWNSCINLVEEHIRTIMRKK